MGSFFSFIPLSCLVLFVFSSCAVLALLFAILHDLGRVHWFVTCSHELGGFPGRYQDRWYRFSFLVLVAFSMESGSVASCGGFSYMMNVVTIFDLVLDPLSV